MKKLAFVPLVLVAAMLACKGQPSPPPPPPVTAPPPTTQPPPVSIKSLALGKAIGADKKVTSEVDTFAAKDTIYLSIETDGTGHAKLRALWSFVKGDKTAKVDESTIEMDGAGPTANELHISKPSGWPKGGYKVEVFLNDSAAPAMAKTFKVG